MQEKIYVSSTLLLLINEWNVTHRLRAAYIDSTLHAATLVFDAVGGELNEFIARQD